MFKEKVVSLGALYKTNTLSKHHPALINLSVNQITSIDKDTFSGLNNLTSIYLSHNQITSIDKDIFEGLTNLTFFLYF